MVRAETIAVWQFVAATLLVAAILFGMEGVGVSLVPALVAWLVNCNREPKTYTIAGLLWAALMLAMYMDRHTNP